MVEDLGWVVRRMDQPDYGIDDQVEVFDGDDATGVTFLVQSRGTDTEELPDALKVKIKRTQQNYFRSLNDPVLIARYHSPTESTFVRWFHQVDPYPRRSNQTITLTADNELTPDEVEALADEVRRQRALRSSDFPWPVRLSVTSDVLNARRIALEVAGLTADVVDTIVVDSTDPSPSIGLAGMVSADSIKVDAGLASFTSHGSTEGVPYGSIARALLLGAADVLQSLGHGSRAADLYEVALREKGVAAEMLEPIGVGLGSSGRLDVAVRVASRWVDQRDPAMAAGATLLLAAASSLATSRAMPLLREAAGILESISVEVDDSSGGDDVTSVVDAANLAAARIRFAVGDWDIANRNFSLLAAADGASQLKADLIAEVAGAAFEVGEFSRAIELYGEASKGELTSGEEGQRDIVARIADAHMANGDFDTALDLFATYAATGETIVPIWALKQAAAEFVVKNVTPNATRKPAERPRG